jgi:hypothetical protein
VRGNTISIAERGVDEVLDVVVFIFDLPAAGAVVVETLFVVLVAEVLPVPVPVLVPGVFVANKIRFERRLDSADELVCSVILGLTSSSLRTLFFGSTVDLL